MSLLKFIKLSFVSRDSDDETEFVDTYVNISEIVIFSKDKNLTALITTYPNGFYKCKETPEQILKLMEEPLVYRE